MASGPAQTIKVAAASDALSTRLNILELPATPEPEIHPDVKIQAELLAVQEPCPANENRPPPPSDKD